MRAWARRTIEGAVFALLMATVGCGFPFGWPHPEPTDDGGSECTVPYVTCRDWRCPSTGATRDPMPAYAAPDEELTALEGLVAGTLLRYRVERLDGGVAQATFQDFAECETLVSTVTDPTHASFTWRGVTVDGLGEPTADEARALAGLRAGALLPALAQVPLTLGRAPDVPDDLMAALVFPLQVVLKYEPAPETRAAGLTALLGEGPGSYLDREDALPYLERFDAGREGPLRFGPADLFPHVFGYLALDAVGATEARGQPLEGDRFGPCDARCRGACGGDCPSANCRVSTRTECATDGGEDVEVKTYTCGVHDGCVEHDNCYDTCHATHGCGTFSAWACRWGCDKEAGDKYGTLNGLRWARGGGVWTREATFDYRSPAGMGTCTCVAPGTLVTVPGGARRPIETLSEGAEVLGLDLVTGALTRARVERVLRHAEQPSALDRLDVASGQQLELTPNHPVFTGRGFVPTEDLVVGDTVYVIDAQAQQTRQERLVAITRRQTTVDVTWNLKTTVGNYFAAELLVHNKCLAADATVETPQGERPIATLRPGDVVRGARGGAPAWTTVEAVFRKETWLPALPGRQVTPSLRVTDNHVLSALLAPAGSLPLPPIAIEGPVFDLETGTGNYVASGVLLEAANSTVRCTP